jgi:hypothetical protein
MEELPREVFVPGGLWVLSTTPNEEDPLKVMGNLLVTESDGKPYLPVFTSDRLARGFLDHIPETRADEYEPLTYNDLVKFGRLLDGARHLALHIVINPGFKDYPKAILIQQVTDAIHHHLAMQTDHRRDA